MLKIILIFLFLFLSLITITIYYGGQLGRIKEEILWQEERLKNKEVIKCMFKK